MKIFVPEDSTYDMCYVVQSEGVIRGYDTIPRNNANYNYRDYYINSDYIYRDGSGSWSSYTTLPTCLDQSVITNDIYYRVDLYKILIIFIILAIVIIVVPFKLMSRVFGRWLRI